MRLFKCNAQMTLTLVELDRSSWKVLPPKRLTVALTLAAILIGALVWGVLG